MFNGGCYCQIKDINFHDKSAMDDAFTNYSSVVNDVTGVMVTDGENQMLSTADLMLYESKAKKRKDARK